MVTVVVTKLGAHLRILCLSFAKQPWDILTLEGATNAESLYLTISCRDKYEILFRPSGVKTHSGHKVW